MERVYIEATSKRLKLAQIFVVLLGLVSVGTGAYLQDERGMMVGGAGLGVAFVGYCLVRLLRWWESG
jgi:hypothetical protein